MDFAKLRALFSLVVMVYIVSPVIFKYSPFIQRSLLFMNRVNTQFGHNLSHPETLGIRCTRTLRLDNNLIVDDHHIAQQLLKSGDKITPQTSVVQLGVWHILPESSLANCFTTSENNRTSIEDRHAFSGTRPIILYIHGNGGTRGGNHRTRLYKRLAYEYDYHIVTFDYRGYGDSTDLTPTAAGLSLDARFMYEWLLKQPGVTKERLFVWGHSLGTAVAVRMIADLPQSSIKPRGLVLEAPFDSIANAVANHPFSTPFRIMPYFEHFFVEPIERSPELNFDSAGRIVDIKQTSIMILHAEDDGIIPYKLGRNLYETALKALGKAKVKLVTLGADLGLGHKHICVHDETMIKVKQFIDTL